MTSDPPIVISACAAWMLAGSTAKSASAFDDALNLWVLWSEHCRPAAGTADALEAIFATSGVWPPRRQRGGRQG